jgi:hypothetical protein
MVETLQDHESSPEEVVSVQDELDLIEDEVKTNDAKRKMTHEAFASAERIETMPTPQIIALTEKILAKCLKEHASLQAWLSWKNIKAYQNQLYNSHPELRKVAVFDLWINDFSCAVYDDLQPSEKIKLLAFEWAMKDMLPISPWLKQKSGKFNAEKLIARYRSKIQEVTGDLLSTFKRDQAKNLLSVEKTLINNYWFTPKEATNYVVYLQNVQKEMDAQPWLYTESWIGPTWYAFIAGIIVWVGWVYLYKYLVNPRGMAETQLDLVKLGEPSTLAKLITAEQWFSVTGKRTESMFDTTGDSSLMATAKDLINNAQSRTVTMLLEGKVAVEYDFNGEQGASFKYSNEEKMIIVDFPKPNFTIRDENATVLQRNSEVIEVDVLNNTEQNLIRELKEKTLSDVAKQEQLINMSQQQLVEIIYLIYEPFLTSFGKEVKGVRVNVAGTWIPKTFLKG